MTEEMVGQVSLFDADGWFGKMSAGLSVRETPKAQILPPSLKKQLGLSATQNPYSMCLKVDSQNGEASAILTDDGALLGELWMRSFGEAPSLSEKQTELSRWEHRKGAREFALSQTSTGTPQGTFALADPKLSQILETDTNPKYYLSPLAARGIIRRASNRGKELPEVLRVALESQSDVSHFAEMVRGYYERHPEEDPAEGERLIARAAKGVGDG